MERTCKKCGETKQIDEFVKNQNCKHGHTYQCCKCSLERAKMYSRNPTERRKEYMKKYIEENKEKIKERMALRTEKKEEYKEGALIWLKNNKEKRDAYVSKYWKSKYIHNREILSDRFVKERIKSQTGLKVKTINEHPELIENYREQIKVKRLLKSIKNENTKTS